jgi:hypothetical protein
MKARNKKNSDVLSYRQAVCRGNLLKARKFFSAEPCLHQQQLRV